MTQVGSAVPSQFNATPPGGNGPQAKYKHKRGLVALSVGSSFLFRCKDGHSRQFSVKSRRVEMSKLEEQGRADAKVVCRCFTCKLDYASYADLAADIEHHPSQREMEAADETHVWAYFCDELESKEDAAQCVLVDKQIGALQRSVTGLVESLDKVKDALEYQKVSASILEAQETIKKLAAQKSHVSEKRVGIMSDVEASQ